MKGVRNRAGGRITGTALMLSLTLVYAGAAAQVAPVFRADAWFLPGDKLHGFVKIPDGPFLMGSDPSRDSLAFDNELWAGEGGTPHEVDLPAFYIARYEVTVAQYRAFVQATGHPTDEQSLHAPDNHPVAYVTWPDALAYARWLEKRLAAWPQTAQEIANLLRDGWHLTLPSEAQWEKAARGTDGRAWPWGNRVREDRANFRGRGTVPVGSFVCDECPWGISDLSGNVWEWTRTPYRPGPYRNVEAPVDLTADAVWVMRGGSFADDERNIRAGTRGGADPGVRRAFIGFRLVLTRDQRH
jgi:formylglycine-generating enzyme required for sulfatase activity